MAVLGVAPRPLVSGHKLVLVLDLPPFDLGRIISEWGLEPVPFVLTVWIGGLYGLGLATLRRRGDSWPVGRTVAFAGGTAIFYVATSSGLAAYDTRAPGGYAE